jgi:acetyl esterase
MADRSRWDPEMAAFAAEQEKAAAAYPPVKVTLPLLPHRKINDLLGMRTASGGPEMAETTDRWVAETGRRVQVRVYRPVVDRPIPTMVYFHGGGWVWSNVDTHDRLAREYAAAGQVAVVSVDYALSPEAKFPQALLECAGAVRHVAERGAEWGLDQDRIFVGGDSAGGNLALGTALLLRETGGPALKGILAGYPVCDARFDTPSYEEFSTGYGLSTERMAFYWSVYVVHELDRLNPMAAPLRADLRGLPPVCILQAELDVLRSEGEALADKLRASGVEVEHTLFPGTVHAFLRATETVGKAREAIATAGAWLRRLS